MSVENWKDPSIPEKQLALNLQELTSKRNYPQHWIDIMRMLNVIRSRDRIVDIGCGVGSFVECLKKEGFDNEYHGIDFSESMITCASKQWDYDNVTFATGDVMSLDVLRDTDVLLCNGLLSSMPNAITALRKILSYNATYIILSRVCLDTHEQHAYYDAYGIPVPKYVFCNEVFHKTIKDGGYGILQAEHESGTFVLNRNTV
jgi:2-polyprenyl-3-methyl-5-hydroxy-6-metoxy-1,4-benzoquinol methylase